MGTYREAEDMFGLASTLLQLVKEKQLLILLKNKDGNSHLVISNNL